MRYSGFTILLLVFLCISNARCQDSDNKDYMIERQLPDWFEDSYKIVKAEGSYRIDDYINPFYLEADFNGDGAADIAVLIREINTGKKGILICHRKSKAIFILGAGKVFNTGVEGSDNFKWMDIWKVYREPKLEPGVGETQTIKLKNPAIFVEEEGSASAVIYWTGKSYKWYQQGD